jgi:hypothetical protein
VSTKTHTVRIPANSPDVTSDQAAHWLDAYLASPADLGPDPGAGERSLRLSLDKEKVEQGARAADEPEATFLRRLIATNIPLPQETKEEARKSETKPKALVLKGAAKLRPDQVRPLVQAFEAGQSYALRKAFKVPQAIEAAAFTEEEREQLSVAVCEVLNRRAPQVLVENIDIFGLVTTVIAIESRKIEQVQAVAEYFKQTQGGPAAPPSGEQRAGGPQ